MSMNGTVKLVVLAACAWTAIAVASGPGGFLDRVGVPGGIEPASRKPVVIAVVDDGLRASHHDLRDFVWTHPKEIPGNRVDDDGNGFIDDVHGWDVSDDDDDAGPAEGRLDEFYHGTHLAGVMTRVVRQVYGDRAHEYLRIMPVKSIPDRADRTYVRDGYEGIDYAVRAGAQIILAAWGQDSISPIETRALQEAEANGVLIVASAGNFSANRPHYPAAHDPILAVAALDPAGRKSAMSNFGAHVDLSAPGTEITGADVRSDTGRASREGSSQAAAVVAAAAAVVKLQHPSYSAQQIVACLKQGARSVDALNPKYVAQLGAGALNIEAAVACDLFDGERQMERRLRNAQSYLRLEGGRRDPLAWVIEPHGPFEGLRFTPRIQNGDATRGRVTFFASVSEDARPVEQFLLAEFPESVYVPGTSARVVFEPLRRSGRLDWLLEYRAEPIDFPRMHCRDTVFLDREGSFEDGSGAEDYSFHSDCKWQITAPEGKVVRFEFTAFDTEPRTDLVYFFDGEGTHEEIMAIFSGPDIPPELTTWGNRVLVWFVSDGENQGKGWRAEYRFVDP